MHEYQRNQQQRRENNTQPCPQSRGVIAWLLRQRPGRRTNEVWMLQPNGKLIRRRIDEE